MVTARDALYDAADDTIGLVDTEEFLKLTNYALKMFADEISPHLQPGERAALFVPALLAEDGKTSPRAWWPWETGQSWPG